MPRRSPRKARDLKAAIYRSGGTVEKFAADLGVTSQHLRLVLSGQRASPRIETAVEAFIAKHLPDAIRTDTHAASAA